MAARQLDEYLTTGNIVNSVNYPDINEPFTTKYRVGIIHEKSRICWDKFQSSLVIIISTLNKVIVPLEIMPIQWWH